MARRLIIDDRTGVLYEDFTGRRIASLGELLNAEAGATETIEVFSVAVNPQTRAVTANTILTANVSLDLGVPRAKPTGGKLTVTYGSDTSGEIPIETLTAETLSSALNRLDAMETAGGCDVWRAAEDDSELSFYVRLQNNGAPGTNPSFDCDGATPPAIGEVTVVKTGASSERALWLVNIAEKPVASIAESAWSTVTSGSFGGLTASLALNGAGLIAHLSKETPGELTLTVKNSSSVLYRGTVDALSSVDPTDLNGSAILSIFPRIVTSTSDPGVTDDSGDGYAVGTLWVNTTADTYFVLADSTAGAAVWVSHLHLTGGTMTGAIAMGSNKITGMADGTASGDAINKGQLDGLIDSAPEALNTLNELAAALGDDVNFSTTVATNIATKLPLAGGTMTGALNTLDINLTDSDVAHGITNVAATDAYGHLSTIHGTQGGLYINGISDQESADARSLALRGICNDTHTDTVPTVEIIGAKRSGTTVQALADAETVLTVANHTTDLLTVLGSGKVGMGIVPVYDCDIVGQLRVSPGSGQFLVQTDSTYINIRSVGTNGGFKFSDAGNKDEYIIDRLGFYHAWKNNTAETMRLTTTGLGINTTAPSSLLDVRGDAGYPGILTLSTAELTVVADDVLGKINFSAPLEADGSAAVAIAASIHAVATDTFVTSTNATDLVFSTAQSEAATEKMRLTSAGNVGIGTASPTATLTISGANDKDTGPCVVLHGDAANQVESGRVRFQESSGHYQGGFVHYDGSANKFHVGVHNAAGYLTANDVNAITIDRDTANVAIAGGVTYSGVQAVTASANLATTAYYCPVSTGGGAFTLTIPTAQHVVGRKIIVKDIDGSADSYNITIATESSQTIDGNATAVISTAKGYRELICTSSTTWHIIASDA